MTEYRVDKTEDGVKVEVEGVGEAQQAGLLEAFRECQEGS